MFTAVACRAASASPPYLSLPVSRLKSSSTASWRAADHEGLQPGSTWLWPLAELQPPPPLRALRVQQSRSFVPWLSRTFGAQNAHVPMKPTKWEQVARTNTHTRCRGRGDSSSVSKLARLSAKIRTQDPNALGQWVNSVRTAPAPHPAPRAPPLQPDSCVPAF